MVENPKEHARNLAFGIQSHDLISVYLEWLKQHIMESGPGAKKVHCVNVMYTVPKFGATFHLAPGEYPLVGVSSSYFKKLQELKVSFPNPGDLLALMAFGSNSPIAVSSARNVLNFYKKDKELPPLPSKKGELSIPNTLDDILFGLLATFSNIAKHKNIIKDLHSEGYLSGAIQCLLDFLPQFNGTEAAAMNPVRAGDTHGEIIDHVRWVSKNQKMTLWETYAKNDSPRDRVFWLLSAVESLQWIDDSEFGIVESLYPFLLGNDGVNPIDEPTRAYWDSLSFLLDRITFYFNIPRLNQEEKKSLSSKLRTKLRTEINRIASLSAHVGIWHTQQALAQFSDDLSRSIRKIAQAILNVSGPKHIFCAGEEESIGLMQADLKTFDISAEDGDKTSALIDQLNKPWGIYEENNDPEIEPEFALKILSCGTIRLHFGDGEDFASIHPDKYQLELMSYIHNAVRIRAANADVATAESDVDQSWYKVAFHKYYKEFDVYRQQKVPVGEFQLRKDKEMTFYADLMKAERKWFADCPPIVLDVGIGYGRLAKGFIDKGLVDKTSYYGLDCSQEMINACRELLFLPAVYNRYMHELEDFLTRYAHIGFNVFIWAYTTFGCYRNSDDIKTLEGLKAAKPYSLVIIEQHNPLKTIVTPLLEYESDVENERIKLSKTTCLIRNTLGGTWADYAGQYHYYKSSQEGLSHIRTDSYCLRLYSDNWLRKQFESMDFFVEFCADFDLCKPYDDKSRNDATVVICIAKKLPFKLTDLKAAINKAAEALLWLRDRVTPNSPEDNRVFKLSVEDFKQTDTLLQAIIRKKPKPEDVKIMKESDWSMQSVDTYKRILHDWFIRTD